MCRPSPSGSQLHYLRPATCHRKAYHPRVHACLDSMCVMGIDCRDLLKVAVIPLVGLVILEVLWNLAPGGSILFWGVKLGILAYCGYAWVAGNPLMALLSGR